MVTKQLQRGSSASLSEPLPLADRMSAIHLPVNSTNFASGSDLLPEAAPEEVGHLDEECAAVAAKSRLGLAGEWIGPVAREVVVIAQIKGCAGVRGPTSQELAPNI